ncbi:MAG: leucine-rich repeat domain-containing protein [Lachnospiraceae bacterium]|nr:leucine-rich repeat domain-containing protein [Lachnospiraceae bacterium]
MYLNGILKGIVLSIVTIVFLCIISFNNIDVNAATKAIVKKGVCTVSGKGKMTQTFTDNKKIKKVVIKKGVTYIPKEAFYGCSKLKSVTIANTVKSIGAEAFAQTGLKKISIPKSVKRIGYFALNSDFDRIKMPGKCSIIGDDFIDCDPLFLIHVKTVEYTTPLDLATIKYVRCEEIIVASSDSKYKSVDGAVYSKDGKTLEAVPYYMKNLRISDKCTDIEFSAFQVEMDWDDMYPQARQEYITIPESFKRFHYDVNSLWYYKVELSGLKGLDIQSSNIDRENINFIFEHFVLNNSILDGLSQAGYINYNNGFLIGDSFGIYTVSSDARVLYGYYGSEEEITIPSCVEYIYNLSNKNVKKIVLGPNVKTIDTSEPYGLNNLEEVVFNDKLERIGDYAFAKSKLKEVVIPKNVESIGDYAFAKSKLKEVVIPENVESIGSYAFEYTPLEYISFSGSIKAIGDYAFRNTKLKELTLPNSIESLGKAVFSGTLIEQLNVPPSLILYEYSFSGMRSLKKVVISEGVIEIPKQAFSYCTSLEEVIIHNTGCKIAEDAFGQNCYWVGVREDGSDSIVLRCYHV